MNNFENIYFFGCSFTELENSPTGYEFTNFRDIVKREYNANYFNYSRSGKSNQEIINDVYNKIHLSKNQSKKLFVIQTTFLSRFGLYCDLEDGFVSMCTSEGTAQTFKEKILFEFYNNWLEYFYNKKIETLEFKKQINLISAYLRENNINFIYIGIDEYLDFVNDTDFFEKNNFLKFGENQYSFYNLAVLNKLRIDDIIQTSVKDYHFNQKGHELLAEKILHAMPHQTGGH